MPVGVVGPPGFADGAVHQAQLDVVADRAPRQAGQGAEGVEGVLGGGVHGGIYTPP